MPLCALRRLPTGQRVRQVDASALARGRAMGQWSSKALEQQAQLEMSDHERRRQDLEAEHPGQRSPLDIAGCKGITTDGDKCGPDSRQNLEKKCTGATAWV